MQASHTNGRIRRWRAGAALGPLAVIPLLAAGLAPGGMPEAGAQQAFTTTVPANPAAVALKVRRVKDGVEVVIENTGTGPQLEQSSQGGSWLGRLTTAQPAALLRGPQVVAVPKAGLASISLEGGGRVFNLRVTPVAGYPVRQPLVSADGRNVVLSFQAQVQPAEQTLRRNSLAPGAVANPNWAPSLRQRASAPPVGDMAVGTMFIKCPSCINLKGPKVTLTFQGVRASTALAALARMGTPPGSYGQRGYGFVFKNSATQTFTTKSLRASTASGPIASEETSGEQRNPDPRVTASFVNEDYGTVFNTLISSTGLQARLVNNTIVVGGDPFDSSLGNMASKVYRLNQASARSAAEYLASLGALIRVPRTFTTTESSGSATNVGGGSSSGGQTSSNSFSSTSQGTAIEAYGGQPGPLQGLSGTIDRRLGTVTLIGKPALVSIAEQYLKQIDVRQRQVALSIKILDVSLDNDTSIDNSFAFRYGNNFIVNDSGQLVGAFGQLLPPSATSAFNRGYPDFKLEVDTDGRIKVEDIPTGFNAIGGASRTPPLVTQPDVGIFRDATRRNPGLSYPRDNFYNFVKAVIESRSTKVLASPTLILSENTDLDREQNKESNSDSFDKNFLGNLSTNNYVPSIGRKRSNESAVVVGEQVIINYDVQAGQNGAANTCQPVLGVAGLTFGAEVSKIDDNGFVTFKLSPAISASIRQSTVAGCGPIDILAVRSLDTGSSRVRDGQTLILTGVLSDRDIQAATKWPILGDLPLVGQFFRQSSNAREKRELVVMVTPRIINDTEGGTYGYGFEPSTRETRQLLNPSPSPSMPNSFGQP